MTHARRVCMAALAAAACFAVPATASAQQGDPTAVVAMGDSAISGEAARNYEPGTDQPGNYCHRSLNALIKETDIPGIAAELNLACSGAESANLQYPGTGQNNEVSQGQKLRDLIDDYDVRMIIVEVGANDDPDFTGVVTDCVAQFVLQVPIGCRWTIGLQWSGRLARMKPKVKATLQSIRAVIRDFGDGDAPQLVLASYWSPVGAANRYSSYWSKVLNGCPIYNADQAWAKNTAVPALNTTDADDRDRGGLALPRFQQVDERARDLRPRDRPLAGVGGGPDVRPGQLVLVLLRCGAPVVPRERAWSCGAR